jgi:hypothetical protein
MSISLEEIRARLSTCIDMCDHFRKHGNSYQRKHLQQRLLAAKEKNNKEGEKQTLAIIQREKDRSFWRHINYVLGKQSSGSCFKVQVPQKDGGVVEHTSQDDLQNAIWTNIHRRRFYLVDEAPLCSESLRGMFGYNPVSHIARTVLAGTYEYPPDFDQAMREIFEKCARIQFMIPKDSVSATITPDAWQSHWSKAMEKTSSSVSGCHFGPHIAGMKSEHSTYLQTLIATLVTRRGTVLDRWSKGLSVMLEKIFGCLLITKLCSILLMEADFNATNKVKYGIQILHNICKYRLMPEEVYSERNLLVDDGTLSKILFYDIVWQRWHSASLASVNANNCYDRIVHPMASMVFQLFGVPTPVESILTTI